MPIKRYPVNEQVLASIQDFLDVVEVDLRSIEMQVCELNVDYQSERKKLMDACEYTHRHAGLYLRFEKRFTKNGDFPVASISWRVGNARHNKKNVLGINVNGARTARVSAGKRCSHYCRTDFRAVMPYAQRWEKDLTWHYELHARALRDYCFNLLNVADALTWFPIAPNMTTISRENPFRRSNDST